MQQLNYLTFLMVATMLYAGAGFAQHRPTVSLGAALAAKDGRSDSTHLFGTSGLTVGLSMPVFKRESFSLGIGVAGDYLSAKRTPTASWQPISVVDGITLSTDLGNAEMAQRQLRLGAGPELNVKLGNSVTLSPKFHIGYAQTRRDGFSVRQRVEYGKETFEKEIYGQDRVASNGLFYAPKLRLSVPIGKRLSVWGEVNYTFQRAVVDTRTLRFASRPDENGSYDFGTWVEAQPQQQRLSDAWNTPGGRAGLSFALDKPKQAGQPPVSQNTGNSLVPNRPTAQSPTAESQTQLRKLVTLAPENNAQYRNASEIKSLQWRLVGTPMPAPAYVVELIRLDSRRKPQRTHIGKSATPTIAITEFANADLTDGQYLWRVTETTTGLVSDTRAFAISNCAVDFAIENDSIECLGYEGNDRKYRICFDASYVAASGDLTYNDPTSGLFVYDQQYNPLTYTLVGQNPSLVSQAGASLSTVHYCVEVTVPSTVNAIGLALQGDDLDPSPVLCQPGVSLSIDSLPDCLCNDCETMEVSFDDMEITPHNATSTQYLFDGSISVNQAVYGIEVQVLSYQYSANPGGCTTGVNSVETSGMILSGMSTINGSGNLQAATKVVRYLSTSPITGPIPLHLVIGLPGTLPGFDADCCAINYEVCLKVNVLYEDGSCKACSFIQCFQFDNQ
ncbi:hypothetical protein [Parapedobacter sp. 2B3]|uniref:hypothetical protein n=1 Tax=Parapedobacter sp. 2B3 TaxID=3342381 RepID=UPI0035B587E3